MLGFGRARRDQAIAEERLPAGTRYVGVDGVRGWLYPVTSGDGDEYELFAWFDGAAYQVRVVVPDVFGRTDHHACHLFPDGRICFGSHDGGGMSTLESAYARSVVWANGFSRYRRTFKFPF
jgi:hypothetical protein